MADTSIPEGMTPSKFENIEPPPLLKYKRTQNSEDPIVNFSINNPIPPIKRLLKKLFANEEITIKIPVLTAIAILAFGLGGASGFLTALKVRLAERIPVVNTIFPTLTPQPTQSPWIKTVFFGTLSRPSTGSYFLIKETGEVVKLIPPSNVNMEKLIGKKIIAEGLYNKTEEVMNVEAASDLVLFASTAPVPTTKPTSTPNPTETPVATTSSETNR